MKIKLISPRQSLRPMDSNFKRKMSPPLGLLTIAALTPKKHEVYLDDENVESINFNDQPDFVGITVNVDTAIRAYQIAKMYQSKGVPVILGGIHPSSNPKEAKHFADSILIGEAEEIWSEILKDVEKKQLKQMYFAPKPADLSKSPIPRWEIIKRNKYLYHNVMVFSRGCPWKCEFCYNSCKYVHNIYRTKEIDQTIEEIKALNVPHVLFIDDNFIGDIPKTKKLLKKMIPLKLRWSAAVSANVTQDDELLDLMVKSGCKSLFIGFETINQNNLKENSKYQNRVGAYEELVKKLHDNNIMINASLVFGFDHDTEKTFDETLNWIVDNKIETVTTHILTPYPGTLLQKNMIKENRIFDFNWNHYNTAHVVF
ncbi:B12-binding domain-containing radical SAM protein [Patescibacteria group bacterium]